MNYEPFWIEKYKYINRERHFEGITIKLVKLLDFMRTLGISRYDLANGATGYTHTVDNVCKEISRKEVIDIVEAEVMQFEEIKIEPVTKEMIMDKLLGGIGTFFKEDLLNRLRDTSGLEFIQDTQDSMFFPFENGLAKVTKEGIELQPYEKSEGKIWASHIVPSMVKPLYTTLKATEWVDVEKLGMFAKFCFNISGQSTVRYQSLCTIIGYNLHHYYETKRRATVFTDSQMSENPEGRTGKTLLGKALAKIRSVTELNGKSFRFEDRFRWQSVKPSTQVAILNDTVRYFDIELLFNDITEGISVEYKSMASFSVNAKIIINTNQTIKILGGSAKDRVVQFELANHYSDSYTPEHEFKCWFFRDWDVAEWNRFNNFMLFCAHMYLRHGIIKPESINLGLRTILEHCGSDFYSFINNEAKKHLEAEEFVLQECFNDFKLHYPDAKNWDRFRTQNFTQHLKMYAEAIGKQVDNKRSNGQNKIKFI